MRILYQALMALSLLVAAPFLLFRRGTHYGQTLVGRVGGGHDEPARARGGVWVHAVSVGEVAVARTLLPALPNASPLVVTTVTPTGQARARDGLATDPRSAEVRPVEVAYLPFDLGFAIARFFRRFTPRALILVEGDYWPLVLHTARRHRLPVAVVNGRVGDTSFRRWRTVRRWAPRLFEGLGLTRVDRFAVQGDQDRERLLALGVAPERVTVTGNLKYDTPAPAPLDALEGVVRGLAGERAVMVAGSTMQGEDPLVLDAFAQLGGQRAMLVLVPRHPERWDAAEAQARGLGLTVIRRSALGDDVHTQGTSAGVDEQPDVLLLDTFGELAALYRAADAAFVGGTLVATGGHNPLEPARFGVPIVAGPSMFNFRDIEAAFDAAGAWTRVHDAPALASLLGSWIDDPSQAREVGARARALVEAGRGALARTGELLQPLLASALDPISEVEPA